MTCGAFVQTRRAGIVHRRVVDHRRALDHGGDVLAHVAQGLEQDPVEHDLSGVVAEVKEAL